MPILWIILAFLALLIWGNLSRKSCCHPLNNLPTSVSVFTPSCALKNTSGDNMGSGTTVVAGVCEPLTPVTCHGGIGTPMCYPIVAHLPIDPPPIAIQAPTPITGIPIKPTPIAPAPIAAAPVPKPIFPVAVGSHPAPVSTRIVVNTTNSVLLRQTTPTNRSVLLGQKAQGVASAQENLLPVGGSAPVRPGSLAAYYSSLNAQSQQTFDLAGLMSEGGGAVHCSESQVSCQDYSLG